MQKHKHKCKQNFILVLGLKVMLASMFSWSCKQAFLPLPLYICLMNTSPVKQGLTYIKGMRVNEFGNKQVARLRPSK